jgi:hypothetical protein
VAGRGVDGGKSEVKRGGKVGGGGVEEGGGGRVWGGWRGRELLVKVRKGEAMRIMSRWRGAADRENLARKFSLSRSVTWKGAAFSAWAGARRRHAESVRRSYAAWLKKLGNFLHSWRRRAWAVNAGRVWSARCGPVFARRHHFSLWRGMVGDAVAQLEELAMAWRGHGGGVSSTLQVMIDA